MSTSLKCPKCSHEFEPSEALREELRLQMRHWQNEKEKQWENQWAEEKKKIQKELESNLRKSISSDYEYKLKAFEDQQAETEKKLKEARIKEIDFLKKEQALKNRAEELQLEAQRQLQIEREKLVEEIRKFEENRIASREREMQLKMKEMEKQLEDQKKLVEEMRRKGEQVSMQLQGESQELLLEELLRGSFQTDQVTEVGKGVEGADCILTIRNAMGTECGKIIFESKRTKGWNNNWVDKLKHDMRQKQADLAILVSQVYPKGMECFGERDGVWICSFSEVIPLTVALRNAIIRIAETRKAEENKGEKMQMLYNYLTGLEFRQQIEAIVEGFLTMKQSISRERIQMEKIWKEREKQLDKVLLNTSGLYGSIKGIAGASVQDIPLLESGIEEEEPEDQLSIQARTN